MRARTTKSLSLPILTVRAHWTAVLPVPSHLTENSSPEDRVDDCASLLDSSSTVWQLGFQRVSSSVVASRLHNPRGQSLGQYLEVALAVCCCQLASARGDSELVVPR